MSKRYGLYGDVSHDFLTLDGRVLVHDNAAELAFLVIGATPRELPSSFPADQTLPIRLHPDLAAVRWPLDRRDFR